jgi:hypothetical protein
MLKVKLQNLWPGAFQGDFLWNILHHAVPSGFRFIDDSDSADILIGSICGSERSPPDRTIQIIWENVRPNMMDCRFSLSCDRDEYGGRKFYLPLWMSCIKSPGFVDACVVNASLNHGFEAAIELSSLIYPRKWEGVRRDFCVFIANNVNAIRVNLLAALSAVCPLRC